MGKTGNQILEQIKLEIEQLKAKTVELEQRITELSASETEKQEDKPFDILLEDEISFAIPKRREELGVVTPDPEPLAEPEIEPVFEPEPVEIPEEVMPVVETPEPEKVEPKPEVKSRWQLDTPASELSNILSAIALKERGVFINALFKEDAQLFIDTVAAMNAMTSLSQAEEYIKEHFSYWKLNSDVVYRFMMAVRRKLR